MKNYQIKLGNRKLDSMTQDEFKELMNIVEVEPLRMDDTEECDSIFKEYFCKKYEDILETFDNAESEKIYIEMGEVRAEVIGYLNPLEVVKWFIEKDFNVFGGLNE